MNCSPFLPHPQPGGVPGTYLAFRKDSGLTGRQWDMFPCTLWSLWFGSPLGLQHPPSHRSTLGSRGPSLQVRFTLLNHLTT